MDNNGVDDGNDKNTEASNVVDASVKDKDDDEAGGTSVGENGNDSNANDNSASGGDEEANNAKDDSNEGNKKLGAYLGIFQIAKKCKDNMIKTGKTAVADKDCNNTSASKEDDDAQETHGDDEEAGPNDEGDSNVASDTIPDNKVVSSGDNGGIIRVRG
jgi:hypothetical protein